MNLENLVRENIKKLTPYSSARKEFSGTANIFLDANENSFGSPIQTNYHRYPDPLQIKIKEVAAIWNEVKTSQIFIGNGSDEAIDLLFRIFCEPKIDNILICPPTYGMYEVSAEIKLVSCSQQFAFVDRIPAQYYFYKHIILQLLRQVSIGLRFIILLVVCISLAGWLLGSRFVEFAGRPATTCWSSISTRPVPGAGASTTTTRC